MKRHRGLKRYYRNLQISNDLDKESGIDFTNPDTWTHYWHLHIDWWGFGNNSFKRRKPHLDKLFRHFEMLVDKTKSLKQDFQLYTIIFDFDSSCDALFLHTPNSNGNAFTFKMSDLNSSSNLTNQLLDDYINNLKGYKILYGKADEKFCLIYKDNIGKPFE